MATFHENLVQSFHNFRDKYLKANGNFFKFSYDTTTKKYGFTINGTFHPFDTHPFDTKDDTISYTSNDNSSIFNSGNLGGQSTYAWTAVSKIATGEKHSSLLNKVSTMFKNIRTIAKLIGTTDISSIGNGTLSGGISALNNDLTNVGTELDNLPNTLQLVNSHRSVAVSIDQNTGIDFDGYIEVVGGTNGTTLTIGSWNISVPANARQRYPVCAGDGIVRYTGGVNATCQYVYNIWSITVRN